jgi:hypothetical protein
MRAQALILPAAFSRPWRIGEHGVEGFDFMGEVRAEFGQGT